MALELLQRGRRVTVCESNAIGAGATGGSTGHLDAHPEIGPRRLVDQLGEDHAAAYVRMRLDAIERISQRSGDMCEFTHIPAYYYTESDGHLNAVQKEFREAQRIGLNVSWEDSVPIPKAVGGYRIDGMARIDSLAYLLRLAELVRDHGGEIFEQTMVSGPVEACPDSLQTSAGKVKFDQVICAVHCNFTDSYRLYFQTPAYQSYVIAARIRTALPDGLFWDNSHPYFYVRRATPDGRTILVGGCDHRTGDGDESVAMQQLQAWTRERFSVEEVVSRWSAEFFEPTDGLPFIGKVAGKENVWIATGLSGVGLTLGTAAGVMIADLMEGKTCELSEALSPGRVPVGSAMNVIAEQIPTATDLAERVLPARDVEPSRLQAGEGSVGNVDGHFTAVCRSQDGCLHHVSPICTHMGGVLRWNPQQQTWDCPVHGGRFAPDGKRLYGPPEIDLDEAPPSAP